MKKTNIISFLLMMLIPVIIITVTAFRTAPATHSTATVDQQSGLLIFIYCTPSDQFETLGTAKLPGIVGSGKNDDLLNTLIKRTLKEFPSAEGIILHNLKFENCDVIKFK